MRWKLIPVLQYFPRKCERVTDRTCCHVKLQFAFKWPYKKLCKSPWLHLWTVTDQIKANAIWAVLQCGTLPRQIILGLGFKLPPCWGYAQDHSKCKNRTWSEPPHFQPRWKLTIKRNGEWWCILYSLHSTDQEQMTSWDHAFAKHVTELCMGTTVKQRLLIQPGQMRWCKISLQLQTMNWGNTNCLWISQVSEWPLEMTCALPCMCSLHNYTFKLGKKFHLHFCTWPSVLQGFKISPMMFYYISYWNLRTFSCRFAFPSPASFCISQCISG